MINTAVEDPYICTPDPVAHILGLRFSYAEKTRSVHLLTFGFLFVPADHKPGETMPRQHLASKSALCPERPFV